jgi:hypothetical protein
MKHNSNSLKNRINNQEKSYSDNNKKCKIDDINNPKIESKIYKNSIKDDININNFFDENKYDNKLGTHFKKKDSNQIKRENDAINFFDFNDVRNKLNYET